MYDFEIIFPENCSHPLYPLCVWACNDVKQLVWVNFLYVGDSCGVDMVFFVKTALVFYCFSEEK